MIKISLFNHACEGIQMSLQRDVDIDPDDTSPLVLYGTPCEQMIKIVILDYTAVEEKPIMPSKV